MSNVNETGQCNENLSHNMQTIQLVLTSLQQHNEEHIMTPEELEFIDKDECSICLDDLHGNEDGGVVASLPTCTHHFHLKCIEKWSEMSTSCPCCKTKFKTMQYVEDGETKEKDCKRDVELRGYLRLLVSLLNEMFDRDLLLDPEFYPYIPLINRLHKEISAEIA